MSAFSFICYYFSNFKFELLALRAFLLGETVCLC